MLEVESGTVLVNRDHESRSLLLSEQQRRSEGRAGDTGTQAPDWVEFWGRQIEEEY